MGDRFLSLLQKYQDDIKKEFGKLQEFVDQSHQGLEKAFEEICERYDEEEEEDPPDEELDEEPVMEAKLVFLCMTQHDAHIFHAYDRILSTLACVIALRKWKVTPERIDRGLQSIRANISNMANEDNAHMPVGFEIIFPSLLEAAKTDKLEQLGIARHFESEIKDCLDYVYSYWTDKGIGWARHSVVSMRNKSGSYWNVQFVDDIQEHIGTKQVSSIGTCDGIRSEIRG
eukprot:Gb_03761 [translate_table: standard]